jgi:hypothetical protein
MSDNPEIRGSQDRTRINPEQKHEVQYWTNKLGVSEDKLREATKAVGNSAEKVEEYLKKNKR